jgi:hypothetical protein
MCVCVYYCSTYYKAVRESVCVCVCVCVHLHICVLHLVLFLGGALDYSKIIDDFLGVQR